MALTLIPPAATPVVQEFLESSWDERTLQRLPDEEPELGQLLMGLVANGYLGLERETASMDQAAVLLGSDRLEHAALWYLIMNALTEERHCSDAVTLGGYGLSLAGAWRFDPYRAVSLGLGARFGSLLLRCEKPVSAPIQRILDTARPPFREQFETEIFGLSGRERAELFTEQNAIPAKLRECLVDPVDPKEQRFTQDLLDRACAGEREDRDAARRPILELSDILRLSTIPFELPPRTPDELMGAFGEALGAIRDRDERIETLQNELDKVSQALELATLDRSDLMSPPETLRQVTVEVDRANRYKRKLSILAVKIEETPSPLSAAEQMAGAGELLERVVRSMDSVGQIDKDKLLVILPETPLKGARSCAERIEYFIRTTPIDHEGTAIPIRARFYATDLSQEKSPDAEAFVSRAVVGADSMNPSERTACNTEGLRMWRSPQD